MRLGVAVLLLLVATMADAQERFSGSMLSQGRFASSGFTRFDIWIDEYSTGEERDRLARILADRTESQLRFEGVLLPNEVGRLRFSDSRLRRTRPIEYAQSIPTEDDGRLVTRGDHDIDGHEHGRLVRQQRP